jgi:competence protein ComEC
MNGFLDRLTVENVGDNLTGYSISKDTNLYSVVYKLSFKQFSALFSGDMPPEVSDRLSTDSGIGDVDYIKIPHHGSVNGITEKLIKAIVPKIAVISVGKNPWSFPRQEVLDILAKYNVNVLRTDQKGDIELVTDGEKYWIK